MSIMERMQWNPRVLQELMETGVRNNAAIEAFIRQKEQTKEADVLPGGKADSKTDKDFDPQQVAMGHKVEMEHTKNRSVAAEITRDHLTEVPDYYTRLKKMED